MLISSHLSFFHAMNKPRHLPLLPLPPPHRLSLRALVEHHSARESPAPNQWDRRNRRLLHPWFLGITMVKIGAVKEREMKLRRPREAEFDLFVSWSGFGRGAGGTYYPTACTTST